MSVSVCDFGTSAKGQTVDRIELRNASGITCSLLTYGATIQSLSVPGDQGQLVDVVLGYDTIDRYEQAVNPFHGETIGRHANRISGAAFDLGGRTVQLFANEGRNNLHSCPEGFNQVVWNYKILDANDEPAVEFTYHSPDGESGFPGNLDCRITFRLTADQALEITYNAVADQETVINLTNHAYFNLAGQGSGEILDHELQIMADAFTPIDSECLPDGRIAPVATTPFDFSQPKPIGQDIAAEDEQLRFGSGFDHNFVLRGTSGNLRPCVIVREPKSGRTMIVETTSPGVQLYTGNRLDELNCKAGADYLPRMGFCLETQYFPDSLRHPQFPSPVFKAGETFHHVTVYRFSRT